MTARNASGVYSFPGSLSVDSGGLVTFSLAPPEGDDADGKSVYYHYATQGEKTQDFMWWLKQEFINQFKGIAAEFTQGIHSSNGFSCKHAIIRVGDFDPHPDDINHDQRGLFEGFCTIRTAKGRRSLFFEAVPRAPAVGFLIWAAVPQSSDRVAGRGCLLAVALA